MERTFGYTDPVLVWEERDVSHWAKIGDEARGLRPKRWLEGPDGGRWLRKSHRPKRPYEPAIEALMLRLASAVGVASAEGHVCTWRDGAAVHRGLVVRSFLARSEELTQGAEVLKGSDPSYDPNIRWAQTLDRVRAALEGQERLGNRGMLHEFAHVLTFDAWIGNADRHQGNWGIITPRAGGPRRLAPMYDPATCLGVELLDSHRLVARGPNRPELLEYREKCPSGFGDGTMPVALHTVTLELARWPEWRAGAGHWLARFRSAMDNFESVLETVPLVWLPSQRRRLMIGLLKERLSWLESLV